MLFEYLKETIKDKILIKTCLTIAIPLMFQQLIVASVNLVDNLMVGELGDVAVSGVSCANRYYNICQYAVNGLIVSCIIFLSQYNGANDNEHMKQSFRFSIVSSYTIIILFFLLATFIPEKLIGFIINDPQIIETGSAYIRIACLSYLPLGISFPISQSLRATGETRLPVIMSMVSLVINILFDYLLIFGHLGLPALGVKGAAIATVLARIIEAILYLYAISKNDYAFNSSITKIFHFEKSLAKNIIIKAIPLIANETLWQFGMTTLIKSYSSRGAIVNTAYSISVTISDLFFILFAGMATATTILVGTPLGANKLKEAKDNAYKLICFSMLLSLVFGLLMASSTFIVPLLYSKVSSDSLNLAKQFILVMSFFYILYMFNTQCFFTLRTGGDTRSTMFMDSCFMWLFNIPLVAIFAYKTNIPVLFVYIIGQSTDFVKAGIAYRMVRKEKWVKNLTIQGNS